MKSDPLDAVRNERAVLASIPESAIDFSDLHHLKVDEWKGAVRGKFYRSVVQQHPCGIGGLIEADVAKGAVSAEFFYLRAMC